MIVAGAPFVLLRTDRSAEWALKHWQRWTDLLDSVLERAGSNLAGFAVLVLYMVFTPILGMCLRVAGAVYSLVTTFGDTISEMPRNWFR